MRQATTDSIPVHTDPFEIVLALCEVEEWELARRLARSEDAGRR